MIEEDGQRLLQPDWTERAILLEIIRAAEVQGIVAWDKVSRIARRAADRVRDYVYLEAGSLRVG